MNIDLIKNALCAAKESLETSIDIDDSYSSDYGNTVRRNKLSAALSVVNKAIDSLELSTERISVATRLNVGLEDKILATMKAIGAER